ncbi:CFEM domain-containing protein [Colletotrichum cuscutae]|uniref:CFEM domain-containing protein n=1 Tax=Colletotrichum cuscutae TaxID=1209917 RepID=A0AAI9UWP0_9PEZI|nr:CFEM domain-containing protein [Colletotrichum cuscutae]
MNDGLNSSVKCHTQGLGIESLLAECASQCVSTIIASASSAQAAVKFLCVEQQLYGIIGCSYQNCSVVDGLKSQRSLFDICGLPNRDRGASATASAVAGAMVAVFSVGVRIYSRLSRLDYMIGLDDYALIFSMLMSVPMSVVVVFTVQNGLGKDIWTLTPEQINEFFKLTRLGKLFYIGEHFYAFTVMFAKTKLLFFYLRLFSDEKFRRLTWGVIWACVISAVSFLVATSVQCWPISYTWTKWDGEHQGRCHDINVQTRAHASVNIALDVVVVAMPISQIVRLNWRWRQKVGAGMMFAVALLITFVSILRLSSIRDFMKTSNPTWDIVPISNWSFVELNGFIFCSCMPAFRDYFRRLFLRRRRTVQHGNSIFGARPRMRTIGNSVLRPSDRLHELISVDNDTGEPDHSLRDISHVDLGIGHHSTVVLPAVKDEREAKALAANHSSPDGDNRPPDEQPEEVDLGDLKHLAPWVSEGTRKQNGGCSDAQFPRRSESPR